MYTLKSTAFNISITDKQSGFKKKKEGKKMKEEHKGELNIF